MTPEAFARALVAAARQVADGTPAERHATVRRIHESIARRRRVHRRWTSLLAAFAAALFGSTALAWYAGWHLPWTASRAPITTPPRASIVTPREASPARAREAPEVADGPLTPEAHYARALLLIRLERWRAAEVALRPFADAPGGSYRQAEAARLIESIRRR